MVYALQLKIKHLGFMMNEITIAKENENRIKNLKHENPKSPKQYPSGKIDSGIAFRPKDQKQNGLLK